MASCNPFSAAFSSISTILDKVEVNFLLVEADEEARDMFEKQVKVLATVSSFFSSSLLKSGDTFLSIRRK